MERYNIYTKKHIYICSSQHKLDATHHTGPHPLTPPNLVKHVAKADPVAPAKSAPASTTTAAASGDSKALEFGQLAARYRRAPISEAEMEAIEVRIYTHRKVFCLLTPNLIILQSGGATFIV